MRRIGCFSLGLMALLAATGPAAAQAEAGEAARIRAAFEAWLPSGVPLTPSEADYLVSKLPVVQSVGAWQVEPDGTGYSVISPGIRGALFRSFEQLSGRFLLTCDPDRIRVEP